MTYEGPKREHQVKKQSNLDLMMLEEIDGRRASDKW
jgi:hypothetical protein